MDAKDVVVNLIGLSGGKLVGRTRLQKEAYLLDCCGADLELSFTYHHYGPYSFDLADGWDDAKAEGCIEIEEQPGRHGVPYSIFALKKETDDTTDSFGRLSADAARVHLDKMKAVSDVVLELAATIVFLRKEGHGEGTIEELKARKPLKATAGRIKKAVALLRALNLEE